MISKTWKQHWNDLSEFFKYPLEIRRAIYTTNAVQSLKDDFLQTVPVSREVKDHRHSRWLEEAP